MTLQEVAERIRAEVARLDAGGAPDLEMALAFGNLVESHAARADAGDAALLRELRDLVARLREAAAGPVPGYQDAIDALLAEARHDQEFGGDDIG